MLRGTPMLSMGTAWLVNMLGSERTADHKDIILYDIPQQRPNPKWVWSQQTLSMFTRSSGGSSGIWS